ncbi:MAG: hypothetical protein WCP72_10980 [Desulfomonile sp.]
MTDFEHLEATGSLDHFRVDTTANTTWSHDLDVEKPVRTVTFPFGIYDVKIEISPKNEFIRIVEVKANKDFMSYEQKRGRGAFQDVKDYYRDEDDE